MTDYTKATNFTIKDSLSTGDSQKRVRGTEIDAELSNIATAVNSKANIASPTFTGTPSAPTPATNNNSTQVATTAFVVNYVDGFEVQTGDIAANAITTAKITDANITTAKIADNAVTTAKIVDNAITTAKITDSNITNAKIANAAITSTKLSGNQTGSAPIYGARAWVTFAGNKNAAGAYDANYTTRYINGSGNVTSVTRTNTGTYTVLLSTALPNAAYAWAGSGEGDSSANNALIVSEVFPSTRTTTSFQVRTTQRDSGDDAAIVDPDFVSVVVFG